MIKLLLFILACPSALLAQADRIIPVPKDELNDCALAEGIKCYSLKDQALLDEALESGIECRIDLSQSNKNLEACRRWRDKYKSLLQQTEYEVPVEGFIEIETHKWTKNTWVKFGVVTGLALLTGIGIGIAFLAVREFWCID